jgi:hypothetical protein
MAIHKLDPRFVETVKTNGMYADGGGLYLQVRDGAKSWLFRYHVQGRRYDRHKSLGALHTVGLAKAREEARKCRGFVNVIVPSWDSFRLRRHQSPSPPKPHSGGIASGAGSQTWPQSPRCAASLPA